MEFSFAIDVKLKKVKKLKKVLDFFDKFGIITMLLVSDKKNN